MSYYETGSRSKLSTNRFLYRQSWTTTSANVNLGSIYTGERTGGSAYWCDALMTQQGVKGLPHVPRLGNAFHGIGASSPETDRIYADDCACCGTRIVNRFNLAAWHWDGWRPSSTVPVTYVIEELPYG